jgi:hypothetical protein
VTNQFQVPKESDEPVSTVKLVDGFPNLAEFAGGTVGPTSF